MSGSDKLPSRKRSTSSRLGSLFSPVDKHVEHTENLCEVIRLLTFESDLRNAMDCDRFAGVEIDHVESVTVARPDFVPWGHGHLSNRRKAPRPANSRCFAIPAPGRRCSGRSHSPISSCFARGAHGFR